MASKICRATVANSTVKMITADTTEIVQAATNIHGLSHVASAALGRVLTAAAMMGQTLKGDTDSITIQIKGNGPLGGLCAVTDSKSNVRGYVNHPSVELPLREDGKLDVGGAVGKEGLLSVITDFGFGDPYIGQSTLISGEIGVDLTYYFASSEQTPSVVAVGVLVAPNGQIINSGGYIIQLMPGADEKIIKYIENTVDALPPVTSLLLSGENPESMVELFFGEHGFEIMSVVDCEYKCNCAREKMERGMIALGQHELKALADEQEETVCHCHFCNKDYKFSKQDIENLIQIAK